ncbi:hypothetical protein [Buttiauxella ferragutiae]|uniref:hypothetical protein n=1 Tax=Buttiauxella ferragutiae TaxID=82989 RepID=UPI00352553CA
MIVYNRFFIGALLIFLSLSVFSKNNTLLNEIKNNDGSKWLIEKNEGTYNFKYTNEKGEVYVNSTIITSDIEGSDLFLDKNSAGHVSLTMDYPRDIYVFEFSSGEVPRFLSACKQITLSSVEQQQTAALLTLCSKDDEASGLILSNVDVGKLLAPDNLALKGKVKTVIGCDKSFLYDSNKKQKKNKPYLIKGDIIEIQEYNNTMLKIKYSSKSKDIVAWIKFGDIL